MPSFSPHYGSVPTSDPLYSSRPTTVAGMTPSLNPPIDSPERQSSSTAAIFNLTNSLLGGGTLSLPYVFAKCGVYVAVVLVFFAMSLSMFSLNIICKLSEKLGCESYSEVMEKSLGRRAKQVTTYCLAVILLLVIIAYLILLRDVASEVFEYFTPDSYVVTAFTKNTILTALAAISFPLMTADSLHALRHTSYCGATCIVLLLGCLCQKAYQHQAAGLVEPLQYQPGSVTDVLTALPITVIAFLCHFNVNGILCDLAQPHEIRYVVRTTVSSTAMAFLLFGISGYVFAGSATADNILKNFSAKDPVLLLARLGLTVTLMTQLPIMVIPCRKIVYPLLWPETNIVEATQRRRAESHEVLVKRLSSPRDQLQTHRGGGGGGGGGGVMHPLHYFSSPAARSASPAPQLVEVEQGFGVRLDGSTVRYGLTLLILLLTLMLSQSLPGVSVVWTVAGSTLTIVIVYLLPAAAYISTWRRLGPDREWESDVVCCYAMFGIGVLLMLVCTPQALHNAFAGPPR